MKRLLIAAAAALVPGASAMANSSSLGCWNTTDIEPNSSPSGTYVNNGNSTSGYISPENEGVGLLLASLDEFDGQSYIICMDGSSSWNGYQAVWQPSSAIICPSSVFTGGACPD